MSESFALRWPIKIMDCFVFYVLKSFFERTKRGALMAEFETWKLNFRLEVLFVGSSDSNLIYCWFVN